MIPIYLYLLLGSIIIPLIFSIFFIDFIKHWKHFIISTTIVAVVFLIWDALFTHYGIWAFNKEYCIGFSIFKMPIEEWLFFYVIPFCSLFIHFALGYAQPQLRLTKKLTRLITIAIIILIGVVLLTNLSKAYTAVNFSFLIITLVIGLIYYLDLLQRFYLSFLIILIPFFMVNGVLTGSLLAEPVVSYNNLENLGIRIVTIPIEDIGYAFTMLFGNLMIFEKLNRKRAQ